MPLTDSKSIKQKIISIHSGSPDTFQTNYCRTALNDNLIYYENDKAVIFLQPEFDFYKLYYAAANLHDLAPLFSLLPKEYISMEIITRTGIAAEDMCTFLRCFEFKAIYRKMEKTLVTTESDYVVEENPFADQIYEKINAAFDKVYDHFLPYETVKELSRKGGVVTVAENGALKAYAVYRITNKGVAALDFFANCGSKANLLELWRQFYASMNHYGVTYVSLWCNPKNTRAIRSYTKENFINAAQYNYFFKYII